MVSPGEYERSTKGGKESAARSANLGGCKGRAANEDRRQTKRTRMGCGALKERKKENGKNHNDVRYCVHIGTRRELLLSNDEGDR